MASRIGSSIPVPTTTYPLQGTAYEKKRDKCVALMAIASVAVSADTILKLLGSSNTITVNGHDDPNLAMGIDVREATATIGTAEEKTWTSITVKDGVA